LPEEGRAGNPELTPIDCDEVIIEIPESPNPNPGGSEPGAPILGSGGSEEGPVDDEITMPDRGACWVWDEQICGMNTPGHYGNDPACNAKFKGATFLRNRCNGESIQLYRTMVPYEDPCNPLGEIGVLEPLTELEKCIELKKLTNNDVINASLHQLKINIDQNHEKAFTYARGTNPPVLAFPQTNATGNTAKLRILMTTFGIGHIHQKGTAFNPSKNWEMFSIADIQGIYKILQSYDDTPDGMPPLNKKMFFNMMMVDGYTYCVFPNDADAFKNLGSIFGDKDKVKDLEKKLKDLYTNKGKKEYNELTKRDLAQHFPRFINNVFGESGQTNMNMSLYRISNNNHFSGIGRN
jgi:hypothetical protein